MRFYICLLLSLFIANAIAIPANSIYGQRWMEQQPIVGSDLGQPISQQFGGELFPEQLQQPIMTGGLYGGSVDQYNQEDVNMPTQWHMQQPMIPTQQLPFHRAQRILNNNLYQQLPNVNQIMLEDQQNYPTVGLNVPVQQRVARPYRTFPVSQPIVRAPVGVVNSLWNQINQDALLTQQQTPLHTLLRVNPDEQAIMAQQWAHKLNKFGNFGNVFTNEQLPVHQQQLPVYQQQPVYAQHYTNMPILSGSKSPLMTFAGRSTNTPIVQSTVFSNMPTLVNHLQGQLSVPVSQPITSNAAIWRNPLYQRNQPLVQPPILEAKNAQFMQSLYSGNNLHTVGLGGNIGFGLTGGNVLPTQLEQTFPTNTVPTGTWSGELPTHMVSNLNKFGTGLSSFDTTPTVIPTTVDTGYTGLVGGQQQQMLPIHDGVDTGVTGLVGGMQQQQMFGVRGQQF